MSLTKTDKTYTLNGTIKNTSGDSSGLTIIAYDKDLGGKIVDDSLGSTTTDTQGNFTLSFHESLFNKTALGFKLDPNPDIYFEIHHENIEIPNNINRSNPITNARASGDPIEITIDYTKKSTLQSTVTSDNESSNNSDTSQVVVINQLNIELEIFSLENKSNSPKIGGKVTYTKIGTVAANKTAHFPTPLIGQWLATASGKIPNMHEGSGKQFYQFPISHQVVSSFNLSNEFTITKDDITAMVQSYNFHQYSVANGNSAISKAFGQAIKSNTGTPPNPAKAVNAFFSEKAGKNFSKCTLATYNLVATWLTQFTSGWQGKYYLYKNLPATDTNIDDFVDLFAVLDISSSSTSERAKLSLYSKGVPNGQTVDLTMPGDGTMVDDSPGADAITASLNAVWANLLSIENGVSKYETQAAFGGTIMSLQVTGTEEKRKKPKRNAGSGFDRFKKKYANIMGMINPLVSIAILGVMVKQMMNHNSQSKVDAEKKAGEDGKNEGKSDKEIREDMDAATGETSASEANAAQVEATEANAQRPESEEIVKNVNGDTLAESMAEDNEDDFEDVEETMKETGNASDPKVEQVAEEAENIEQKLDGDEAPSPEEFKTISKDEVNLDNDVQSLDTGTETVNPKTAETLSQIDQSITQDVKIEQKVETEMQEETSTSTNSGEDVPEIEG